MNEMEFHFVKAICICAVTIGYVINSKHGYKINKMSEIVYESEHYFLVADSK